MCGINNQRLKIARIYVYTIRDVDICGLLKMIPVPYCDPFDHKPYTGFASDGESTKKTSKLSVFTIYYDHDA